MTNTFNYIDHINKIAADKKIFHWGDDAHTTISINYDLLIKRLAEEVFLPITYEDILFVREIDSLEDTYCKGEDLVKSFIMHLLSKVPIHNPETTYKVEREEILYRLKKYNVHTMNPFKSNASDIHYSNGGFVRGKLDLNDLLALKTRK